jgi:hypothetical protein
MKGEATNAGAAFLVGYACLEGWLQYKFQPVQQTALPSLPLPECLKGLQSERCRYAPWYFEAGLKRVCEVTGS